MTQNIFILENLFFVFVAIAVVALSLYSCSDDVNLKSEIEYKGSKTSLELRMLLQETSNPTLSSLDSETKESLVKCTIFEDGRLQGFENIDENIDELNNSNMLDVLSAILQHKVVDRSVKNRITPVIGTDPWSYCSNCWWQRDEHDCCQVGGEGCVDY